jgi:hypothetical protein
MKLPYLVFDSALFPSEWNKFRQSYQNFLCLFWGQEEGYLGPVAPFLLEFDWNSEFKLPLTKGNWGNSNIILINSKIELLALHRHLRKFLLVKTEDGEQLYFRFYDPRVLRIFLPTCDTAQLKEFFGPVEQFICEDEDPAFGLVFSLLGGQLITQRLPVQEIFPEVAGNSESAAKPEMEDPGFMASKTEFPLEFALFEGEVEVFEAYLKKVNPSELADLFSNTSHFYVPLKEGNFRLFFLDVSQMVQSRDVSSDEMNKLLEAEKENREKRQKAMEEDIRKKKTKDSQSSFTSAEEPGKKGIWSWLKI